VGLVGQGYERNQKLRLTQTLLVKNLQIQFQLLIKPILGGKMVNYPCKKIFGIKGGIFEKNNFSII